MQSLVNVWSFVRTNLPRVNSTPRRFPSHLLLRMHSTEFSFCFFPGFFAIFILLSLNNNNDHETLFSWLKCTFFNRGDMIYSNDDVGLCSNSRISFNIYQKIIAYAMQKIKWLKRKNLSCFQNHLLIYSEI